MPATDLLFLVQIVDQPWRSNAAEFAALLVRVLIGLSIAFGAYRFVRRVPLPRPFQFRFLLIHLVAAPVSGLLWLVLTSISVVLMTGRPFGPTIGDVPEDFMFIGSMVYFVIAGVTYLEDATARAARAEAAVAQTQLATLRAHLQPHFLFNALHTVVQLIPVHPDRAVEAAELVAGLLRTALDEERELVPLREEWLFVSCYLELEGIRFGERLRLSADIAPDVEDVQVPVFSLQTLVENAVRHGAAPRVEPTDVMVRARCDDGVVVISVRDTGPVHHQPRGHVAAGGTGLRRLRERLEVLHGDAAHLRAGPHPDGGYEAVLRLPRETLPA